MTGEEAVRALTLLATEVGIEVRFEPFELRQLSRKGGLCRIRGRPTILVDAALAPLEQAGILGEALAAVDLRPVEVPAGLLPFLRTGHGRIRPLARLRPLARGRRP